MLRSALAAAFSAALAIGALSGLTGAKGDAAQDSTWRTTSVSAAGTGDSTWIVAASATPGDSTWVAPTDSTWVAES
ncbi:hypothetical protein [Streptomyces sp. NPDC057616]|uniref:hypothetical protein n=1 Tax=Streptomyces sp. NPDC057616 TaxID=3346183 RepID=UPI0036899EE3